VPLTPEIDQISGARFVDYIQAGAVGVSRVWLVQGFHRRLATASVRLSGEGYEAQNIGAGI
jgi:hypothetical protein